MMKLKLILEEIQHDTALKLISDLIKSSKWKNKVFLAGGAVRDELMGMGIKDLDMTVAAPNGGIEFATWLAKKLKIYRQNTNPVIYPRFGTAKISLKGVKYNGVDLSSIDIECVMTRKEQYQLGNRKPEVDYGTPEQDVERRDLTINSLLKDLTSGEILDLTGKGLKDLRDKVIRTPLDPNIIFKEDPLRMLRAIRFTVKYNWKLPLSMINALKKNAYMLKTISSERIQEELNKILLTGNPDKGIRLMQITGLMKYIAPELDTLQKMKQNDYHKWDASKHTLQVIKNTPNNLITRLAAMFHDIGKNQTKTVINNEIHFYEHEDVSADMAKDIMTKLKYPTDIINAVYISVKNHMRTKSFGKNAEFVSDKALRKLQNDLGDHLENVLDLIHADNISHGPGDWQYNLPNQVPSIRDKMKNLGGNFTQKLILPLDGNDIIKLLKLKPGPIVGKLLSDLKDAYLENPKMSKSAATKFVKDTYNKKYK